MRSVIKGKPTFKTSAEKQVFTYLREKEAILLKDQRGIHSKEKEAVLQEIRKILIWFVTSFAEIKRN